MKANLPNVLLARQSYTFLVHHVPMYVCLGSNESKVTKCSSCSSNSSSPCQVAIKHGRLRLPFVSIFRAFSSLWKSETLTLMYGNLVKGKLKRYGFMLSSRPLRSDKESFCQRCSSLLTFYEEMNGEYLYFPKKHCKNCECCPRHSLFKGHNVLNCQKCNQCLKVQVSSHKFLGLLSSLIVIVFVIVFVFVLVFLLVMSCLLITLIRFRCLQGHMSLESLFNGVL